MKFTIVAQGVPATHIIEPSNKRERMFHDLITLLTTRPIITIITALIVIALTSCDHPRTKDTLNQIQGGYDEAKLQIGPVAENVTSLTSEQINKIIRYEYKVITLPASSTSEEMEGVLSSIGQERWECFSVIPSEATLKVFCRRLPYALLRSLLRFM